MITLRPAAERGRTSTSWLDSRHTFSFGEYFDQTHMGFRVLRVINDDRVAPRRRLSDARARRHGDPQLRAGGRARPPRQHGHGFGDSPRRRATHDARARASATASRTRRATEPVHFLQIWITPGAPRPAAGLRAKALEPRPRRGRLCLVGVQRRARRLGDHPPGRRRSTPTILGRRRGVEHRLGQERYAWVQVAAGAVELDGRPWLKATARRSSRRRRSSLTGTGQGAEVLVFDLA